MSPTFVSRTDQRSIGFRRRNKNKSVEDDIPVQARLPQEILNQIIAQYHTSYPEQPLYPLFTSRSLYEATVSCLYRSVVFTIKRDKRDRWLSLLTSLRKHGPLVRSLELREPAGPKDQTELGRKELLHTFLGRLAELSQLRELSIKCLGAKLPVEILVTASQLPRLRALKLNNLSLIGTGCDNVEFSTMAALREARLIDVREHDGSLKWSSFIPSTLNQSTQHFEYYKYQGSNSSTDDYSFLQILEEQPQLSFPEMRELCLPRPITAMDVDRGLRLLRCCPSLQALGFESVVFQRTWGTQINDLGTRIPWDCLSYLRTIKGPPGLVSTVAPGRPVQKATILLDRQTEFPLLSALEALRQSTVPLEALSIFTSNWRETSTREVAESFPRLQGLAICVINVPVMVCREVSFLGARCADPGLVKRRWLIGNLRRCLPLIDFKGSVCLDSMETEGRHHNSLHFNAGRPPLFSRPFRHCRCYGFMFSVKSGREKVQAVLRHRKPSGSEFGDCWEFRRDDSRFIAMVIRSSSQDWQRPSKRLAIIIRVKLLI